ncbi:PAS domain-containing sensor histidine kinase [Methylobacterium sp. E-005]|uniref:PAS domain-containing protein n=1 Tax=Methylobacterium sp. E-005 TaxID=2836549 RepID=UPI001FBA00AF|nr:PAS domain-containing protein [Methylobacterium sp. E-005]MCJ2089307.1 PAS domain-containing sensor histidine kinase [Methylobacterium sp. E-005]
MIPADPERERGLAAAFTAWKRLPNLSPALAGPDAVHLVFDAVGGRILHASEAARTLSEALAGSSLATLCRQIASAAPDDSTPRLARLRLDPRRIAPPTLCWLARGRQDDGTPVILVALTGPVSPRARKRQPEAAPAPAQAPAPVRGDRFLWRLDPAGTVTLFTGPDILAGLVGQRLQDLAAAGGISGADGALAALRDRKTFRGEPAVLDAGAGPCRVELSGAPIGRGEAAFAGFAGFGLIRGLPAPAAEPVANALPERSEPPPPPAADPVVLLSEPGHAATAGPEPAATALSTDEHAAFREIARALGARYAGDEAGSEQTAPRPEGGAVMPFPGPQTALSESRDGRGGAASSNDVLNGLPLPALMHRDGVILAANRRLLAITGDADLPALSGRGLGGLLPGALVPDAPEAAPRLTAVTCADGQTRPVEILSGAGSWAGEPAASLIVRPVDEADAATALTAERLARAAQAERALSAEAALNALDSGIVMLDQAGRIVAVNRAAATLFGCEPREIVGGSFVAQFDRDCVLTVADALRGVVGGPRRVTLGGVPVTLDVKTAAGDGRLVAILEVANRPRVLGTSETLDREASNGAGTALARLDRAVREPLPAMIELADAMLKEPFGALGDARYRAGLAEIKASGDRMLERVGKLLDLAAVEAGALHLEPRRLDLNDVAAGCVAQLQAQAARGRIVVRTSFSSDLAELEADERSVSRAAALIIENAIRRSAAGGQIIVSTGAAELTTVALRVRHTGAAARPSPELAGDVEEGLALPRALVEANGGRLQLSTPAEDGTLVEIIMPTRRAAGG